MRPHPLASSSISLPPPAGREGTRLLVFLACLLLSAAPALAEVVVKAALEPEVIGIDETVTFTIEVRSGSLRGIRFRPAFELDNLEYVSGPHRAEDMRYFNGAFTSTVRMSWRLRPLTTGRAGVHSVVLQMRNETVRLRDRVISVQEEPTGLGGDPYADEAEDPFEQLFGRIPRPWRPRQRQPGVFLRATVEPQRPFVGQQAVYTVHLYTRDDVSSIQPLELPTFRGFWVRDLPQPQHVPTEMVEIDGVRYGRVVLLQKAMFPLRPGRHALEPTEMDILVRVLEPRFFGPPLSRPQQVRLRTSSLAVHVQPLPPAPAGFGGAVGRMSLQARLEPSELRMGEAATLTVTLSGRGNLQSVPEPRIEPPPGLTLSPPQQQGDERIAGTTLHGSRTWSYVVVPERPGRHELRVPEVSYFDPQSRRYQVAAARPLAIRTLPRISGATADGEPHPIRSAALAPPAGLFSTRMLPWLFALPWGLALVITLVRRRQQADPAGSLRPARRPSGNTIDLKLREAEAETRPRQAAARIEEVWREHLAARWDIPPGTPSPRWREMLAGQGADPAAAEELVRLADDLHYLRYAPQLSATGELISEAVSRSRRLLRRLR